MKAFFLDRDGVINESHNVNKAKDLVLLPSVRTIFIGEKAPAGIKPDFIYPSLLKAVNGLLDQGILQ